eukprot:TRINITY_DN1240_c0_g1_i1.p2 TRINITY_DN1240_c0_g1~~TRINITY_DN1240_c0_g1_i1.p2  ORF type:complete len:176 (+),score=38.88 TRINITY_DN1240_c0_g1_i1:827-1354(+)
MGNAPSQQAREEEDVVKGVVLSKTDTGEIKITEGFVEQLDEQVRSDTGHLHLRGRQQQQFERNVSQIAKAAKQKGRSEMKSEMEEEMSNLNEQLLKERNANKDLKDTSLPVIHELADSVCSKLASTTQSKPKPCSNLMNNFLECSRNNPNRTLYCTPIADSYVSCVKSHRQQQIH